MWIRATNGECFNLAHFQRIFIQRGAQGSFDNKLHLTLMGVSNSYTDIAIVDLHEKSDDEAMQILTEYFDSITAALADGSQYVALPQTGRF